MDCSIRLRRPEDAPAPAAYFDVLARQRGVVVTALAPGANQHRALEQPQGTARQQPETRHGDR